MNRYHVAGIKPLGYRVIDNATGQSGEPIADYRMAQDRANALNALNAALDVCERRPGEFWQRLAGSIRKGLSML